MSSPASAELAARIAQLERDLRDLRARIAALERLVGNTGDHAVDRTIVREKVSYDWQAGNRE